MRIVYSGILGAAAVKPISGGGFWAGFFSVLLLIPVIMIIRKIVEYFALKKHGESTDAKIWQTEKRPFRYTYVYRKYYSFDAAGKSYGGFFDTGVNLKKHHTNRTIRIYYDKENPEHHIIIGLSLYEPLCLLILTGLPFLSAVYLFILEFRKCF